MSKTINSVLLGIIIATWIVVANGQDAVPNNSNKNVIPKPKIPVLQTQQTPQITNKPTPEELLKKAQQLAPSKALMEEESKAEEQPQQDDQVEIKKVPRRVETTNVESVIIVVNSSNINKILVISTDGKWIDNARSVTVETSIGDPVISNPPSVTCIIYKGLFKPSKPEIKKWKLSAMITAEEVDFQRILDNLQEGKFSLQK